MIVSEPDLHALWQVTSVHVNQDSERTAHYGPNDPRLKGRFFSLSNEKIDSDLPGLTNCTQPTVQIKKSSLDNWISSATGSESAVTSKSYRLLENGSSEIKNITLVCKSGSFNGGSSGTNENATLAYVTDKKIYINWGDFTVLELAPVSKNEIKPSFNCSRAVQQSEKAICSNYKLASFDESLAQLWKIESAEARDINDPDIIQKLKTTQMQWVKQSNLCGDDAGCLANSMNKRMDEIIALVGD
ncbi:lysozyme inhibitor LprI family protein [Pantoea sp. A4]|uniref:lysozyme inhibitor LprI family protein n=1 Tax=Pantoea sp. A4 TaxID=1225184 RepID=UPI000373DB80|nr:hypothetical protein [Pantoea sp. A4]